MGKFWKAKKLMYIKLFGVIFIVSFIVGIFIANLSAKQYLNQTGILSEYFIMKYKYMDFSYRKLFWFILKSRLKTVIILWGLGFTIIGVPAVWGYSVWMGFSAGMLLSLSVMRMGFSGVIICFLGLVPQVFIYLPCILIFLNQVYAMSLSQFEGKGFRKSYKRGRSQMIGSYMTLLCIIVMMLIVGIFLESHVNPIIISNLLKNY